jgi:hypothetical protein
MNQNTWISWITTGIGLAGSAAVTKGWIDQSTATSVAGAAAAAVPLLWGLFIHRDSKAVETASQVAGVAPIQVLPTASPALQAMAADHNIPTVVPAGPSAPSPYATSASQRR